MVAHVALFVGILFFVFRVAEPSDALCVFIITHVDRKTYGGEVVFVRSHINLHHSASGTIGYGYAKVSKAERDRWGRLMENYFQSAGLIDLGVLIVDARHKPTADDVTMREWFRGSGCPMVVVANKLDKLKAREIEPNLAQIRETLSLRDDELVIPFSAEKGTGKEQLIAAILDHLND